jgi:hypothetical protein
LVLVKKNKNMNRETFGSVINYKMLDFLTEKISLLDDKHKNYISSVITDFNLIVKKSDIITDLSYKNYILDLIHNDFKKRINENILNEYDEKIVTYLKNYFYAKIKNSKKL